jgi:ferritin-like protein
LTTQLLRILLALAASLWLCSIAGVWALSAERDGLENRDREELLGYARATWKSVALMADRAELPVDGLRRDINGTWEPSLLTTPSDIASYLWSVLAAERLKIRLFGRICGSNNGKRAQIRLDRRESRSLCSFNE